MGNLSYFYYDSPPRKVLLMQAYFCQTYCADVERQKAVQKLEDLILDSDFNSLRM